MNRKPDTKNKLNAYQKQSDYGQYDHTKKYRDDEKNKNEYEIYEKEDYSQYVEQNGQDQYYYEAEEYEDQNQQKNKENLNNNEGDNFEDVPNIRKILAKKPSSNAQSKQPQQQEENEDQEEGENQADQVQEQGEEDEEQQQEYEEGDEQQQYNEDDQQEYYDQQQEQGDEDEEYEQQDNSKMIQQKTKKPFRKYEDQRDDEYNQDEDDEGQQEEYERYQQETSSKQSSSSQQKEKSQGILKNQKPNAVTQKSKQRSGSIRQQQLEEDDDEQETEYPQTQSSKSDNYMKSTKSFSTKQGIKQEEKTLSKMSEPFDNIYNTKKYPLGIVDDPELEDERKNLWKAFGRDCAAGRELFSLYKCHMPTKLNYPKPKQKTAEQLLPKPKETKPCPQKTSIVYPPLSYKEPKYKYHKVDFIPKRKPEAEIKKELEEMVRNPYVPINTGKNRIDLIEKLQQKFKYQRGGLPKGAELPQIDETKIVYDEQKIKNQAQKRIGMKNKIFTGQYEDRNDNKTVISDDPVHECNQLFDSIMSEIEERQEYLESIKHLKEPALKQKIKSEIIERVAELQKVTELKQKYM